MFIECPHCQQKIEVLETNCRIFRCGVYKSTFKQIDPHMPKDQCDALVVQDAIYGCGKPFQLIEKPEVDEDGQPTYDVVVCGYI